MSGPLTMLSRAEAYLAEQRRLGFALDRPGSQLLAFARFADASGHEGPLSEAVVLRWAREGARHAEPFTWATRVAVLRPFARHLAEHEPATGFPHGSPFGRSRRRLAPHVYAPAEVEALVAAAGRLPGRLAPATFVALFGLLAATGLRISEALRLTCGDLVEDPEQITVRHGKRRRTRLVPLHPTAAAALRAYLRVRASHGPTDAPAPFFLSEKAGGALRYGEVRGVFLRLAAELGIVARGGHRAVRVHDLRHTFVCRRLLLWYEDGADLGNAVRALSTYVGHADAKNTYWYLEAVPELMAVAGARFEALGAGTGEARHG